MNDISAELLIIKERALKALGDIKPAGPETKAEKGFLFTAQRTDAGRKLPPYYLVYFLLVDLLGFRDLGQFEKVSWSVPIDYRGTPYVIEHRKFGLGVFAADAPNQEKEAAEIVKNIIKAVKIAEPYFKSIAEEAVNKSHLNVVNRSDDLWERFEFFLAEYKKMHGEATRRKDEVIKTQMSPTSWSTHRPAFALRQKSGWLALAAIEAFYSWTEHIFIHLSIIQSKITTGEEVAELAQSDWLQKYKSALPVTDKNNKLYFDKLVHIRKQLRNFVAHGAFGKEGEAFAFHSAVGTVPVTLEQNNRAHSYTMRSGLAFNNEEAIKIIEEFIVHLWSGSRAPAKSYIQGSLPLILTMASDGSYKKAMNSLQEMEKFLEHLYYRFDQAANMDW